MQSKSTRGVQQHEVDGAADALIAERLRPTVERVRQKLGRGSPNTVGPMLENWFAGLATRLGVGPGPGAEGEGAPPPALRQALHDLWAQSLATARSGAAAGVAQEQAQLAQDRDALELARTQLQRQETALAERGAALEQALGLAKAQLKEQAGQLQEAATQLAQARASLAKLVEERDADRRRFDAQAEAAGKERERLQAREQATERRLLEEVDRARQEAKQARAELGEATRRHEAVLEEAQRRQHRAMEAEAQGRLEVAALRERLTAAEQRTQDLQAQLSVAHSVPASSAAGARKTSAARRKPRAANV